MLGFMRSHTQKDQGVDRVGKAPSRPNPVRYAGPAVLPTGLIVSCPHSGQFYPPEMVRSTQLDRLTLRRTEDAFVDDLFADAPEVGADLFVSEFARAFVDVNRSPDELDPRLIFGVRTGFLSELSPRVQAGLGVIPRTLGDDIDIYSQKISYQEAMARIDEVHAPWHQALEACVASRSAQLGSVLLLDCHSMPNGSAGETNADIILGDRYGASCSPAVTAEASRILRDEGFTLVRNDPYPGGYTTTQYGRPTTGRHALQIEINRSLYMVEGAMTRRGEFVTIRQKMKRLLSGLSGLLATL
jgi:N-formylglutamate amidohydrolase